VTINGGMYVSVCVCVNVCVHACVWVVGCLGKGGLLLGGRRVNEGGVR
jgi:hypothetical protein